MMHGDDVTMPLTYFNTGSAVLDRILGGGLPERSVTVIAGEPGAGKTVFTLQMLFHLARQGYKSLYFTTLSEPALKLIRYMQLFSFFDLHLLDDQCHFLDLGSTLRTDGIEPGLAVIRDVVEREEPALVAIDSFKELRHLSINNHGLEVGDPFTDLRGVLTGIPIPMQENPARSQALRQT